MDIVKLGRLIAEEVALFPGPCIYPGTFKPPHVGHWEAAKELASRNYITEVNVYISPKEKDGVTVEESFEIWNTFLKCSPNPKIKVFKSKGNSPVQDAYTFLKSHPNEKRVYLVLSKDDQGDQTYTLNLQKEFTDKIYSIEVDETQDNVNDGYIRKAINEKNFTNFSKAMPVAVNSKGYTKSLFNMLTKEDKETVKESYQIYGTEDLLNRFVKDTCKLLEIPSTPEIIYLQEPLSGEQPSFGAYVPSINSIYVCIGGRHILDAMRTVAHELVHCKQQALGQISHESGETGSEIENEANSVAGIIMRNYTKKHPHLFK